MLKTFGKKSKNIYRPIAQWYGRTVNVNKTYYPFGQTSFIHIISLYFLYTMPFLNRFD